MKTRRCKLRATWVLTMMFGLTANAVLAQQDYPARPIRLVTPAAPGGTVDLLARLIATKLTDVFKQQVIVDNRSSASGVIAAEITAKAPPDGYTLFVPYHQHTLSAASNPNLPYHAADSFTPITQLTSVGMMLVVNPSTPVKNLNEFIEWTKNFKGALNFGSAGVGSGAHLAGELYNVMAGIKAQHIPYKGTGPALTDLVGGQYQYSFAGMQPAQVLARAGKLRALAVTNPRRVAAIPDLPAMAEALPGFEVVGWIGIAGPANLPQPILTRLNTEIVKILRQPEIRDRIFADGSEPVGSSPEEFRRYLQADLNKWAKLFKESGARLD